MLKKVRKGDTMKCSNCGKETSKNFKLNINNKQFYLCGTCLIEQLKIALDLLFDFLVQCCYDEEKDLFDSKCVSTYAEAIKLLNSYSYLTIIQKINSRCITAKYLKEEGGDGK